MEGAPRVTLAVIGGSGLYELPGLVDRKVHKLETPYGRPSSKILEGRLGEVRLLFLARHGVGHSLLPTEVNYRANIYALKYLGARWCVSVSAVGSLREEIAPGHVVVPDGLIDRTTKRESSFFGRGVVGHVPFGTPYCPVLRKKLFSVTRRVALKQEVLAHDGGVYVCIEGPAFSTRAESLLYRSWGGDVIGMTGLPEAKLAREAQMSFANLSLVTDYDCWRSPESEVDVPELMGTLAKSVGLAEEVIRELGPRLVGVEQPPLVSEASKNIIITAPDRIPVFVKRDLEVILGRSLRT